MTPEQKARVSIDALLVQAGWHVCNVANANIHADTGVAIHEFAFNNGFGFADYLFYVNAKVCCVAENPSVVMRQGETYKINSTREIYGAT
jgi:type I restriction enzyme R subunit